MNAYPVQGARSWNANTDLKLIYNIECLCQYLCAYACKPEGTSRAVLSTLRNCAQICQEDGREVVAPAIRSAFIRAHGQRDMSAQELAHCNLNEPLVRSEGVKFVSLDLKGSRRTLNLMDEGPLLSMGIVDLYPIRLNEDAWQEGFQDCASASESLSLLNFVASYFVGKISGKLCPKQPTDLLVIAVAFPKIRALPTSTLYPEYCRLMLLQHKPWFDVRPIITDMEAVQSWTAFGHSQSLFDAAYLQQVMCSLCTIALRVCAS